MTKDSEQKWDDRTSKPETKGVKRNAILSYLLAGAIFLYAAGNFAVRVQRVIGEWDQRVAADQLKGAARAELMINAILLADSVSQPLAQQRYNAWVDSLKQEARK